MRRSFPLLLAAALGGCTAQDRCVLRDGTDALLIVDARVEPGTDSTRFRTLGEAVGAAGPVPTTICVAPGLYRENVVVPGGIALIGGGINNTRLRPLDPVRDLSPVSVDQTLIRLEPELDETVELAGIDVGGAAVCVEATGPGTVVLEDVRLSDCGVGLRAHRSGPLRLTRTPAWGNRRAGIDLRTVESVVWSGPTELAFNGRADTLDGEIFDELSPLLNGLERTGAVHARAVDDLAIDGLRIEGDRYGEAQVVLRGSVGTVTDVVVDLGGFGQGGEGPAFVVSGGALSLERVLARTQGQGLVLADDAPVDLELRSVAWTDRVGLADGQEAGGPAVALDLPVGGRLDAAHVTLWGTGRRPALRTGEAGLDLTVRNSILWGFDAVIEGGATGWGFGWTTASATVPGIEIETDDPRLDPESPLLAPAADSPARCAGTDEDLGAETDLAGAVRPAWAGKLPDRGAVESAEPCPGTR